VTSASPLAIDASILFAHNHCRVVTHGIHRGHWLLNAMFEISPESDPKMRQTISTFTRK